VKLRQLLYKKCIEKLEAINYKDFSNFSNPCSKKNPYKSAFAEHPFHPRSHPKRSAKNYVTYPNRSAKK
jgi:hypothetical protein